MTKTRAHTEPPSRDPKGRAAKGRPGGAGSAEHGAEEFDIGAKIKALRTAKKKTLQDVANETGFSPALISQVENNNVSPPIATLSRIAKVLGVRMGHFFRDEGPEAEYEVLRAAERPVVTRVISRTGGSHGYTYHALTYKKRDKLMEPFVLYVDPDTKDDSQYSHEGEEFLFIMDGEAELLLGEERILLQEGDSVYFQSTSRHRLLPHGGKVAKVLAVLCRGS